MMMPGAFIRLSFVNEEWWGLPFLAGVALAIVVMAVLTGLLWLFFARTRLGVPGVRRLHGCDPAGGGAAVPAGVSGAGVFAGVVGAIVTIPALKMSGIYLAIATLAFGISCFFTGLAGALLAHFLQAFNYEAFVILISIQLLLMVVVGASVDYGADHLGSKKVFISKIENGSWTVVGEAGGEQAQPTKRDGPGFRPGSCTRVAPLPTSAVRIGFHRSEPGREFGVLSSRNTALWNLVYQIPLERAASNGRCSIRRRAAVRRRGFRGCPGRDRDHRPQASACRWHLQPEGAHLRRSEAVDHGSGHL